jgi:hypothetical protein
MGLATHLDIAVSLLLGMKTKDLLFWIKQTNFATGEKVLTQQGTVKVLHEKLAAHYNIDLTTPTPTDSSRAVPGLFSMNLQLQCNQWAHLQALGKEWEMKAAAGQPFLLLSGKFSFWWHCAALRLTLRTRTTATRATNTR